MEESQKQQKVLIVDDEAANISVLAELLKARYRIMVAKSGEQAIKAAHALEPPDLILLDIMMPGMDGYEVCERLKSDPATSDIPIIFISAMGETRDETKGLELGAVDYIIKPISPPILQARVRTHLALQHSREELQRAYAIIKSQKDRMQTELNVGRDIQMSMMPLDFPTTPRYREFSLYARLEAAREVGGDFYDFYFLDQSHFCFCVGDVSGKGVPAALFMAVTKTLIKSNAMRDVSPGNILTHVNNALAQDNESCMFVTLFLGVCDIRSGEVAYSNAGHNPPYIQRAGGQVEQLTRRHGPVAGAMDGHQYRQDQVQLQPGDILLLYTDGVTEAMNRNQELFGDHRLEALLGDETYQSAEALVRSVVGEVKDFEAGADQADDITVLAFRYLGTDPVMWAPVGAEQEWHDLRSTAEVTEWFDQFARSNGIDDAVRRKLDVVFDDLLHNALRYGVEDGKGLEVQLRLELKGGKLVVSLSDNGAPFNPFARASPDITLDTDEREIGGLGIHLVRSLMDETAYQYRDGRNVVILVCKVKRSFPDIHSQAELGSDKKTEI